MPAGLMERQTRLRAPKPLTIGERVRAARRAYGMSQVELSRRTGLSKTTMNNIEKGTTVDPHWSHIVRIAEVLHVSLDALVGHGSGDGRPHV